MQMLRKTKWTELKKHNSLVLKTETEQTLFFPHTNTEQNMTADWFQLPSVFLVKM